MYNIVRVLTPVLMLSVLQVHVAGAPDRGLLRRLQEVFEGCPVGCLQNKCVEEKTTGKLICTKCANNLVVIKSNDPSKNGKCGCRSGRYYATSGGQTADVTNAKPVCVICPKGSFCPGGLTIESVSNSCKDIGGSDAQPGLTTVITAAKTKWACVEKPGWGYIVVSNNPSAARCMGDTYNPGYSKKQCQACPTGFEINDADKLTDPAIAKHDNVTDCTVPPGFFLRGPSEVAACPQGEYQPSYNRANKCLACPVGVTTVKGKINTAAEFCNTLKPGYFTTTLTPLPHGSPAVTADATGSDSYMDSNALPCPQKHWCPGGLPSAAYSDLATAPDGTTTRVFRCSSISQTGTDTAPLWTKGQGAKSKDECLLPPGFGKDSLANNGVFQCGPGYFREGWVHPSDPAAACQRCAESDPAGAVTSEATESLIEYPNLGDSSTNDVLVIGSSGSCQMKPGFGMYQTAQGIRVAACDSNSYGSPNVTYGRSINPCRQCPTNMLTPADITAADPAIKNADDTGYTTPLACVTKPGYGYDGRISNQCPVGTYNEGGDRNECTECSYGFTTEDDATKQVIIDDCWVAPGYEADENGAARECPKGTFSSTLRPINESCTPCGNNRWTFGKGSTADTDCEACAPGYGKAAADGYTAACTDCSLLAGYGPASRDSTECLLCPTQQTGFTFTYDGSAVNFIANPVIKPAQTTAAACLSSFAQIEAGLWYLRGADNSLGTFTADQAGMQLCADACGSKCMFISFDYSTGVCLSLENAVEAKEELIGFKAVSSGDVMGAQSNTAAGKAVASGTYTEWEVSASTAAKIGVKSANLGSKTKADCMAACDMDGLCAGVQLTGLTKDSSADQAGACYHIFGESEAGELEAAGKLFSRSLTHAVVTTEG